MWLPIGPFAWFMGRRALTAIDRSGGTIGGRGMMINADDQAMIAPTTQTPVANSAPKSSMSIDKPTPLSA